MNIVVVSAGEALVLPKSLKDIHSCTGMIRKLSILEVSNFGCNFSDFLRNSTTIRTIAPLD